MLSLSNSAAAPSLATCLSLVACRRLLNDARILGKAWTNTAGANRDKSSSTSNSNGQPHSIYISCANGSRNHSPVLLGMLNYLERHLPHVGFFVPISESRTPGSNLKNDHHVELLHKALGWRGPMNTMVGATEEEATQLIAAGKVNDLLDRVYSAYQAYAMDHELVVVEGTSVGGTEFDAQLAEALNSPVLLTMNGEPGKVANDYYSTVMMKRQLFKERNVDVLGVLLNKLPYNEFAIVNSQLRRKFEAAGLTYAGALPYDNVLASVRLDEVAASLGADIVFGPEAHLDQEFNSVIIGSQRIEELLEILEERPGGRPLVVTSMDRLDIVLGLLAAQVSVQGPAVAGVLLTQAGHERSGRSYAKAQTMWGADSRMQPYTTQRAAVGSCFYGNAAERIFHGVQQGGLYQGALLPVLSVNKPMWEVSQALGKMTAAILPTSHQKITQAKLLFDRYVDMNYIITHLEKPHNIEKTTPKMFTYNLKAKCMANPQHIVLPEAIDSRVLSAASEITRRGLAKVTLLGDPESVNAEAQKLGLDISLCNVHKLQTSDRVDKYVEALIAARKGKIGSPEQARDLLVNDVNLFGVMMVHCGDADGMVSGAMHTTAATIRPALQVLRTPQKTLVSSVFFMCLPDKVLVYGDCAVNVAPSAEELAQIAFTSADTARAFGIEPRVAMLSYSTLGSGAGPDVQKVTEAVKLAKAARPDLLIEGPIQYDAAIDPTVAAVKIKGHSDVAGKANVFIFPDLNTGNNTYKAVQQSTGAIAMGPVMQGLLKPVNDLSRGCTVADIVNTVCVTSIQAQQFKEQQATNK